MNRPKHNRPYPVPLCSRLILLVCFHLWLEAIAPHANAAPAAAPLECVLLSSEGKVEIAARGVAQFSAARTNHVLHVGDRLRTGFRSRATLRWSDLSVVRVDQLTGIELQPPEKAGDKPQLDQRSGASYFFSREKAGEIQFRTPVASGAIRGTEFNLAVGENGRTVLSLIDGEVELANPQGQTSLRSGQQGIVEQGRAPTNTALINAVNVVQWALYYPAVIDLDELGLSAQEQQTFGDLLKSYRSGDLLSALTAYPEDRQPGSDAERVLRAALVLAVGQVDQAEADLKNVSSPFANALRELIAAVKNQESSTAIAPGTASEWMARSYYFQSHSQLAEALSAARNASSRSPTFGAAWIRVAELEFSFGRTRQALAAAERGLELSPRNAEGLALKGFLLSAQNRSSEALDYFDRAIVMDGALGNAWLGRGLVKIRQGHGAEGRADLQIAAALEPQRAVLRSYLGKAFTHTRDPQRAGKELTLAKKLDAHDPTAWLYSALLNQRENRVNEAVTDLQQSKELNENRSVFRSRLLLEQDQAVRSANLAAIYRDAGMREVSVQEAARAVSYDYGNYSAHLFLANSYDALRDPQRFNLRYEAPWFSEFLVANLLAPAGGGYLSQNISQQEYSRFFDANHFGVFSATEYLSRGAWTESGSQYGNADNISYSLDAFYRSDPGQRINNDIELRELSQRVKVQITPQDSLLLQLTRLDIDSGDVAQYYDPASASRTFRARERQRPNLLLGYHHQWLPGSHTLLLFGRFDDRLRLADPDTSLLFLRSQVNLFSGQTNVSVEVHPANYSLNYRSELEAYSTELQHVWQTPAQTLVAGARYQFGWSETESDLIRQPPFGAPTLVNTHANTDLNRFSLYTYDNWRLIEPLTLTFGASYDRLEYPRNIDTSPITSAQATKQQISPKAGFILNPLKEMYFRGTYTRSLGGVFFDTSVRLEPTQIGGFNQSFRSLIPESAVGLVPGTRFETFGLGFDQSFRQIGTYLTVDGQILKSKADRTVGILVNSDLGAPIADTPSSTGQSLEYREESLLITLNKLLSKEYSLGASYRLTHSDLNAEFTQFPGTLAQAANLNRDVSAWLHQVYLYANYHHPSGIFAQLNGIWSQQSNCGYIPTLPGDDFWQFNAFAGYRFFQRRAEARVGLLNINDQDYKLNPLTLYNELPRQRTLAVTFKFYF